MIGQETRMTSAQETARRNWEVNARALARRQPQLARELRGVQLEVEWVFGRDGSLTAREQGQWWSGSSLPQRTAQRVLAELEIKYPVACFLWPTHAQQVRAAMEKLTSSQAMIVAVCETRDLRILLECEAFDREINAGRLWFAWGPQWASELFNLLAENEGLPVPGQIIRTTLPETEKLDAMIATAQEVLGRLGQRRSTRVQSIFEIARPGKADKNSTVAVVAPSMFRLWDDAGGVLARIARSEGWTILDTDDPTSASSIALARASANARAILLANSGRSDLPQGFPQDLAIITWLTGPHIPKFDPRAADDALILAEPYWKEPARRAGWPADRVIVAGWPIEKRDRAGEGLAIVADTFRLDVPEFELSSQRLLWENISAELLPNPEALGQEITAYLAMWLDRSGIAEETLDRKLFIDRLIVPAYQQGVAQAMISAGLPIRLYGRGWMEIDDFRNFSRGPVTSREDLRQALESSAVLVHAWPCAGAHPIECTGRPVLHARGLSMAHVVEQAKEMLAGRAEFAEVTTPVISGEMIRKLVA